MHCISDFPEIICLFRISEVSFIINKKSRLRRLAFARDHQRWTVNQWENALFSDETKVNRFGSHMENNEGDLHPTMDGYE